MFRYPTTQPRTLRLFSLAGYPHTSYTPNMAEETFVLTYDGDAVASGRMDVADLAPALVALGELFLLVNREVNPNTPDPALQLVATTQGSFEVHLILTQSFLDQLVSMFSGSEATAVANLLAYVTGATGLLALLAKLARRAIRSQKPGPQPGQIVLELDDSTTITIPEQVLGLAQNVTVRRTCQEVVRPLTRDGVDEMRISNTSTEISITKGDLDGFEIPPDDGTLIEEFERTVALSIVSVPFRDNNKWRLSDGQNTFFATMSDASFIARVNKDEPFAKSDVLRCELRTTQYMTDDGLRTDYDVLQVVDHVRSGRQVQLPLELDPPDQTGGS